MSEFDYSFVVEAPLEAVSEFHYSTATLKKLTPPPVFVQLHAVEPLGEGSVSEFTMWFGPLPVRWRAVHSNVSQDGFTDRQERGLMKRWPAALDSRVPRTLAFMVMGTLSVLIISQPRWTAWTLIVLIALGTFMPLIWEHRSFCRY